MRPVTHKLKPFTLERVPSIRMTRELSIADAKLKLVKKKTKKGTSKKKGKKVELNANARALLAGMDPATRAFLEGQL